MVASCSLIRAGRAEAVLGLACLGRGSSVPLEGGKVDDLPMSNQIEFAGRNERIDRVLRRLIDGVREERELERITVVTPTNQASFYIRRALAKDGLFNVDFKRLEDIAEHLAGRDFKERRLHDLQASEFVFESARDVTLGQRLGGTDVSPQLQSALHSTFRGLELLEPHQLEQIAGQNEVQRELIARFNKYMELASGYRRGSQVAERAAEYIQCDDHDHLGRIKALGTVLLVEASVVAPVQRPLFEALAGIPGAVTVSIVGSPPEIELPHHPAEDTHRLKPIGVPDVAQEVRSVVREIVEQARSGKRFAQMAVVFEDDSYASRIAEALELADIPVSGPDRTALSDAPEGQFVTGLLDIFENDFSRLDLTAWLSSAPVKDPKDDLVVPASRWDAISRTAGVTSSVNDSWTPRLNRYARNIVRHAERSDRLDEGRANEVEAARSDARYADRLKDFVAGLAERKPSIAEDSWLGFGKWLRAMVDDYLLTSSDDAQKESRTSRTDRLFSLIEKLESLETLGSKLPTYAHCAGVLREQLDRRSAGLKSLGLGVYVGPVWTAAGCPFDAVFVLGMSEGRYPSAGLSDPLLPDPVKRVIDPDGSYLTTIERRVEESEQSFVSVLESAGQVFLYWPSGVPGESREQGPARWFLEAARQVSGENLLQAGDLLKSEYSGVKIVRGRGSSLGSFEHASDTHDFDVLTAQSWQGGRDEVLQFPLVQDSQSFSDSVRFEMARDDSEWTLYDGKIDLEGVESELGETVGSATAFETYAACPYRYFLSRRLRIAPTESPEVEIGLDPIAFGSLIHAVLEEFSLWRMGDEFVSEQPDRQSQEDRMKAVVEKHIELLKEETPGRSDGAWRIEQTRAWLVLRQWLRREPVVIGDTGMRQIEAEYSFGRDDETPAIEVRTASGHSVKFSGQVDRVDISDDGRRVIIYDYKSGSNVPYSGLDRDPTKRGTKLQLPIYSKAIAEKHADADISAAYWFVRESGNDEFKPSPGKYEKDRAESALAEVVETIIEGIDGGVFPARPGGATSIPGRGRSFESCAYCEYERVCPRSKSRLWESKKNSDPALENYRELAEGDQ